MKKTIITEEIDGHKIILGFNVPVIDPVRTKGIIQSSIKESAEYKDYGKLKILAAQVVAQASLALKEKRKSLLEKYYGADVETLLRETEEYKVYEEFKETSDLKTEEGIQAVALAWQPVALKKKELAGSAASKINKILPDTDEYKNWVRVKQEQDAKLRAARQTLLEKQRAMLDQQAVYFTPKKGEDIISLEAAEPLKQKLENLPEKTVLTIEGDEIADRRGEQYWIQDEDGIWESGTVEKLGEESPEAAVAPLDLTEGNRLEITEQAEENRIAALSDKERKDEFQNRKKSVRREAVMMQTELIMDDMEEKEAKKEAKNWYKEQVEELKILYGIGDDDD